MKNYSIKKIAQVKKAHRQFDGKKVYLDYPPLWVTIGITGNCTFKCEFCCSHCPDSKQNEITSHQYKIPFNMPLGDFQKITKMCHAAGVPHIHICGTGEPFLHPRILDFIDYLSTLYPEDVSLQTDFGKPLFKKINYVEEILYRKKQIASITTDIFPEKVHNTIKKGSDFYFLIDCMEKISKKSDIKFNANLILNKFSYEGISDLIRIMHSRQIRFSLNVVNIFPYGFNPFTSMENVYKSSDIKITKALGTALELADQLGVDLRVPQPWDKANTDKEPCLMFWRKVQIMPSKLLPKARWAGNAIPQQCNAVVCGDLFSIGNILDYDEFMAFWNNEKLVAIRKDIVEGNLPDKACLECHTGCFGDFKKMGPIEKIQSQTLSIYNRCRQLFN